MAVSIKLLPAALGALGTLFLIRDSRNRLGKKGVKYECS